MKLLVKVAIWKCSTDNGNESEEISSQSVRKYKTSKTAYLKHMSNETQENVELFKKVISFLFNINY